jgi:hypothetical protein
MVVFRDVGGRIELGGTREEFFAVMLAMTAASRPRNSRSVTLYGLATSDHNFLMIGALRVANSSP